MEYAWRGRAFGGINPSPRWAVGNQQFRRVAFSLRWLEASIVFRSLTKMGAQAHTIGYLADGFSDPYQVEIVRGLLETARSGGANLLCFVGGALPREATLGDGRHWVYELASQAVCDGFVLSGTGLNHEIGVDGLRQFQQRFVGSPCCSVGGDSSSTLSVTPDNERGMERMVRHLIESHGARRLALVRGPTDNDEADLRERAFRSVLQRHKLPVDEKLVVAGDFSFESGVRAVSELALALGGGLTDLDAVVACNDRMAIGVMRALQDRGVAIPADVAVTGFDDITEAELTYPPLSTLRQPMPRLGQEAMRLVLAQVQHRSQPQNQVLEVELVVRRSCGCSGFTADQHSIRAPSFGRLGGGLLINRERIQLELTRRSQGTLGAAGRGWEQRLFAAVVDALQQSDGGAFLQTVQAIAERVLPGTTELKRLDEVVRVLRHQLVPLFGEDSRTERDRLEALMHVARTMLFEMSQRALQNDRIDLLRWNRSVATICNRFSCATDLGELQGAFREHLPVLGIKGAFVALYAAAEDEAARLLCAFDAEADLSAFHGKTFSRRELLPKELATAGGHDGRSYTVQALTWCGEPIGHLLLELDLGSLSVTHALAEAIAGGVHRAGISGNV